MPVQYDIDAGSGILTLTMEGDVTREDFLGFFAASSQDSAFRNDLARLIITTAVLSYPRSTEVPAVATQMRRRTEGSQSKVAVVADSPLSIGMANMVIGMAGLSERFEIFSCPVAARKWLESGAPASVNPGPPPPPR